MAKKHVLERLAEVNPEAEIWWDSSPLVYQSWVEEMLKEAEEDREIMKEQFERLYNPDKPEETLFRGVTTNPPLCLNVFKIHGVYWAKFVDGLIDKNLEINREKLFWLTYKEIVKRGAGMYFGVFEKSNYKYGYISAQVDPREIYNEEKMLEQAKELASLSPNVMVKIPGSKEGYRIIKILTSMGIPTNNTLAFTLPQFLACANAVREGVEIAKRNRVNLGKWRSVITHMTARYGDLGDLKKEAEERGIELSEADIRWAELAIFKKAYKLLKERNYPSKMLICSMRVSPLINGKAIASWHVEKLAGGNIVYTCPPKYIKELMKIDDRIRFTYQIEEEPPKEVLDKLLRIPYFEKGYTEDGLTPEDFNTHSALLATAKEFSDATRGMVDFVNERLERRGRRNRIGNK
jgi:transaldolase